MSIRGRSSWNQVSATTTSSAAVTASRDRFRIHQISRMWSGIGGTFGVNAISSSSVDRAWRHTATNTMPKNTKLAKPWSTTSQSRHQVTNPLSRPTKIPPSIARGKDRMPAMTAATSARFSVP